MTGIANDGLVLVYIFQDRLPRQIENDGRVLDDRRFVVGLRITTFENH